jgi:predicted nucleotidyltransferase
MNSALPTAFTPNINLEGVKLANQFHPAGFPALTREVLVSIVARIAANSQVKKIVMFGSYTNSSAMPTPDSDIDILVIMDTPMSQTERILSISRLLRPRPFPMDILIRTPEEITELQENGDGFFQEIMTQGKVLYER